MPIERKMIELVISPTKHRNIILVIFPFSKNASLIPIAVITYRPDAYVNRNGRGADAATLNSFDVLIEALIVINITAIPDQNVKCFGKQKIMGFIMMSPSEISILQPIVLCCLLSLSSGILT